MPAGSYSYKFLDVTLCGITRELIRDGQALCVEPRVFDLVLYLIEHRDRVVTKDEIHLDLWGGRPLSETVLARCIMKARAALGDCGEQQHIIRTIRGVGYRFVAEVEELGALPCQNQRARWLHRRAGTPSLHWIAAVVLIAAAVGATIVFFRPRVVPAPAIAGNLRVAVLPVRNETGQPNFGWVRYGLMTTLIAHPAPSAAPRVAFVSAATVMAALRTAGDIDSLTDAAAVKAVVHAAPQSYVLGSALEADQGIFRLRFTLYTPDGFQISDSVIGERPVELAKAAGRRLLMQLAAAYADVHPEGGPSHDPMVNEAYARAGYAMYRGDLELARRLLQTSLEWDPQLPAARLRLVKVQLMLDNLGASRALLDGLLDTARRPHDAALEARVRRLRGQLEWQAGHFDRAVHEYRAGLALATGTAFRGVHVQLLTGLARVLDARGKHDEAVTLLHRTLRLLDGTHDLRLRAAVLQLFGNFAWKEGDIRFAYKTTQKALLIRRQFGSRRDEAESLNMLGAVMQVRPEWRQAEPYLEEAIAICRQTDDRRLLARALINLGRFRLLQGRLHDGIEQIDAAIKTATAIGDRSALAAAWEVRGRLEAIQNQLAKAAADYQRAAAVYNDRGDRLAGMAIALDRDRLLLASGKQDMAIADADRCLALARRLQTPYYSALALELNAEAEFGRDSLRDSERHYRNALMLAESVRHMRLAADLTVGLARLYLHQQKLEQASTMVRQFSDWKTYYPAILLRGRYYYRTGKFNKAFAAQSEARRYAGEAWTPQDEAVLETYRRAIATGKNLPLPPLRVSQFALAP